MAGSHLTDGASEASGKRSQMTSRRSCSGGWWVPSSPEQPIENGPKRTLGQFSSGWTSQTSLRCPPHNQGRGGIACESFETPCSSIRMRNDSQQFRGSGENRLGGWDRTQRPELGCRPPPDCSGLDGVSAKTPGTSQFGCGGQTTEGLPTGAA